MRTNILLSTYNGRRYLPELLGSLGPQPGHNTLIEIRDDGSTDDTYSFLYDWAKGRPDVRLSHGPRLGPAGSFFALLHDADPDSEYYAFCDQDDVWLPGKLEKAVSLLNTLEPSQPLLYCSRVEYVDASLHHLGYSLVPTRLSFDNALVENVAAGCTMVINKAARECILRTPPKCALMHDAWCYLVVSAFGQVIYDPTVTVLYRQHDSNTVGVSPDVRGRFVRRLRYVFRHRSQGLGYLAQADEFHRCFSTSLKPQELQILEKFLTSSESFFHRIAYIFQMSVSRQTWLDNAALRGLILLGRL